MRRLLKNQFKAISLANNQTLRGGHGWDRPDVPLDLNPLYVHKREVLSPTHTRACSISLSIKQSFSWDFHSHFHSSILINLIESYACIHASIALLIIMHLMDIFVPLFSWITQLSIFDSNMWMYDQVFPEYVISYNEIFLRDQWGAIKESLSQQAYIAVILSVIAGIYYFNAAPRVTHKHSLTNTPIPKQSNKRTTWNTPINQPTSHLFNTFENNPFCTFVYSFIYHSNWVSTPTMPRLNWMTTTVFTRREVPSDPTSLDSVNITYPAALFIWRILLSKEHLKKIFV